MVQRVVYNNCFGGFSVHEDVVIWVRENTQRLNQEYDTEDVDEIVSATISGEMYDDGSGPKNYENVLKISRDNELLADIVSGETVYNGKINGTTASLQVAEVPDSVEWTITKHDGQETVKEKSEIFS